MSVKQIELRILHVCIHSLSACSTSGFVLYIENVEGESSEEEEETNEFEDDSHDEDFRLSRKPKPAKRKSQHASHGPSRRTREDLVIDRFLVKRVAARVALSPEEARAWYETHPERFPKVEQVRCQQITAATREDLDVLRLDLQQGADFTKLAREKSTSEDKVRAGDLGWFAKGQMLPEFEEACFALKKGQVSPVVPTAYGFHLLRLVDRREGPRPSYAAVQDAVDLELRRERVAKAQAEFLQKLREQADVQINDAALDKVP